MTKMMTANRLSDGAVVYLGADGNWHEDIHAGQSFDALKTPQDLLAMAKESVESDIVIEPYEIDILAEEKLPKTLREQIRSCGPTVNWPVTKADGNPQ